MWFVVQGLLHAVPLEESRKLLGKKGASFFGIDDRKFKSNIPTFSRLSSRSLQVSLYQGLISTH